MKTRTISYAELKKAYDTLSVKEAAAKFGIGIVALYKLLDQAGIERKNNTVKFKIVD